MARKPQPLKSIRSLLLLGAGKMGSAMLEGWLARGLDAEKHSGDRAAARQGGEGAGAARAQAQSQRKAAPAAAIVIAVKPQIAPEAVPPLAPYVGKSTLVLSIMAGRTIGFLQTALPAGTAIVRAMPNTPAAIGRGITVAVATPKSPRASASSPADLLAAIGKVEWVERRGADGRGHCRVRLRPGLCVPAGGGDDARPASPPGCRRRLPRGWRAKPSPAPANCCIARTSTPRRCGRTSPRPAAPPPRRWRC